MGAAAKVREAETVLSAEMVDFVELLAGLLAKIDGRGANLPWLRSDWPEDGNLDGALDDDPQARATFGIWEGRDALIFVRELY